MPSLFRERLGGRSRRPHLLQPSIDRCDLFLDLLNEFAEVVTLSASKIIRTMLAMGPHVLKRTAISQPNAGVDDSLDGYCHRNGPYVKRPIATSALHRQRRCDKAAEYGEKNRSSSAFSSSRLVAVIAAAKPRALVDIG